MSPFAKARAMFALAILEGLAALQQRLPDGQKIPGRWTGRLHRPRHAGARKVAWDKRAAKKRVNVLRHRAACA